MVKIKDKGTLEHKVQCDPNSSVFQFWKHLN